MTGSGSGSGSGSGAATRELAPAAALVEADDAFLAEERALDAARLARVLRVELVVMASLAWMPIAAAFAGSPGIFVRVAALIVAAGSVAWAARRAGRPGLDDRALALVNAAAFVLPAVLVAVLAAETDGIVSPIAHADLVLLAAHALALPRPAKRAAPTLVTIVLSWPLVVLALAAIDPALRAQLDDARLRADFQETTIALAVGALLAGTGQDIQFAIRRAWLSARHARTYRTEEILGEGGMGVVYRAVHPTLGRPVALKKLPKAAEPEHAARFVREVRTTAELTHPNVVRILDCGVTADGEPFYTMELLDGVTLHQLVAATGPLSPERAAHLVRAAARGLADAHARGLVHRDIKPENVFVAHEGGEHDVVKVLDFGIAKTLLGDGALTAEGALIGTPRYMAPEQAVGETIDARTDVYALGGCLYYALSGAPPVDEPTVFAVLAAHAAGTIVPLENRRTDVPPALAAIVARCLRTNRDERFADAAAVVAALDETGLADRHRPEESPRIDAVHAEALRSAVRARRAHESQIVTAVRHG